MRAIAVLHGCCKAGNPSRNTRDLVVQEGQEAVASLGITPSESAFPYYTCLLNRIGRAVGHDLPLPLDCSGPEVAVADVGESDLEAWVAELNQELRESTTPLFLWPIKQWRDVHVYLHHDNVRQQIWNEVKADIDRTIDSETEYVLVAHSLGSIVAADMLREGVIAPSAFVTVGSPLGRRAVAWSVESFQATIPWVNIHDPDDRVSDRNTPDDRGFGGEPYNNVVVDNPAPRNHDVISYLGTPGAREAIVPLLQGSE